MAAKATYLPILRKKRNGRTRHQKLAWDTSSAEPSRGRSLPMSSLSPAVAEALPWPMKKPLRAELLGNPLRAELLGNLAKSTWTWTWGHVYPMGSASGRESYLPTYSFLVGRAT